MRRSRVHIHEILMSLHSRNICRPIPASRDSGEDYPDRREGSFMNTSLRLLLGMVILSIPAVGLQVLCPGWLQDARRELGVLRESRARVATEGERKERLVEATASATARMAA